MAFTATGAMWEKYNVVQPDAFPEAGLYGAVAGFGWSNAVFADFARHLAEQPERPGPSLEGEAWRR